jgi:hypothetical protein
MKTDRKIMNWEAVKQNPSRRRILCGIFDIIESLSDVEHAKFVIRGPNSSRHEDNYARAYIVFDYGENWNFDIEDEVIKDGKNHHYSLRDAQEMDKFVKEVRRRARDRMRRAKKAESRKPTRFCSDCKKPLKGAASSVSTPNTRFEFCHQRCKNHWLAEHLVAECSANKLIRNAKVYVVSGRYDKISDPDADVKLIARVVYGHVDKRFNKGLHMSTEWYGIDMESKAFTNLKDGTIISFDNDKAVIDNLLASMEAK